MSRIAGARRVTPALLVVSGVLLAGCASHDPRAIAAEHGLDAAIVAGDPFDHLLVSKPGTGGHRLHVYIEGDGQPFVSRDRVAADPSPARPVMLELMLRDQAPALYLGRPCYFQLQTLPCSPAFWTIDRYSETVRDSMLSALETHLNGRFDVHVTLIGHSGGGALAVLLAARLNNPRSVVTLSGNLDPERWAEHHGYTPLVGSLSPLSERLAPGVDETHLIGGEDRVVPPETVERYLGDPDRQRANFRVCRFVGCDHWGCWDRHWNRFLDALERDKTQACELLSVDR